MENKIYTARKLKPTGRESWVIEFRHPLIKDSDGRNGRKIRRGLGTKDELEAENLVRQMNELLSTDIFWQPSSRELASSKYHPGIVDAFYSEIEYILQDYEKVREEKIPLKTPADGYSRVLLLGPTGVGKSTLLRQLMGTDPFTERFPTTSNSRTTVFDTEIILSEGKYKAIVTFYNESETRQMVKDSVQNAMIEFYNRKEDTHVLRVFLEDKEQRFRLGYILGKIKDNRYNEYEDTENEDDLTIIEPDSISEEQEQIEEKIREYLNRIKAIATKIIDKGKEEYVLDSELAEETKNSLEEIILTKIFDYNDDDLSNLIDEILSEIKEKFKVLNPKDLTTEKFDWPVYWHKETENRAEFIEDIKFFTSNYSSMFGKLLTPLVSGMRVEGPFKPAFLNEIPKLVFFDGEGLGHIPDTTTSLPSKTMKKFNISDAIILVDNSQSAMLASPYAVIKSATVTGHYKKIFLCFTHFDSVKGDNLPTIQSKIEHIFGAVDGLLEKLKPELDYDAKHFLLSHLHESSYYLGHLDEKLDTTKKYAFTISQLKKLITGLEKKILPIEKSELAPDYEISTLLFKIPKAIKEFRIRWQGHLFGNTSIPKEHFAVIKALSRRLGSGRETEYKTLRPISDLTSILNVQISNFLSSPYSWNLSDSSEEEKQARIDDLKQKITSKIQDYVHSNLQNNNLIDWQIAERYRGVGSSIQRSTKIESIYTKVAPIIADEISQEERKFLMSIIKIVRATIEENGGVILSLFN